LQRFLANERVQVEAVWQQFLAQVLPFWRGKEVTLVLDLTPETAAATSARLALSLESDARPRGMGAGAVGNRGALV